MKRINLVVFVQAFALRTIRGFVPSLATWYRERILTLTEDKTFNQTLITDETVPLSHWMTLKKTKGDALEEQSVTNLLQGAELKSGILEHWHKLRTCRK